MTYIPTLRHRFLSICFALCALFTFSTYGSLGHAQEEEPLFKSRGIGGGGGFFSPTISPFDENLLFVGCDMGGVYRSTNGGKSWKMLPWRTSVRAIQHGPPPIFLTKDHIIWVNGRFSVSVSKDAGKTWTHAPDTPWLDYRQEKQIPHSEVMIQTLLPLDPQGKSLLVGTPVGIWKSTNNKWTHISEKACEQLQRIGDIIYGLEGESTLLKSVDNGQSFERIALDGKVTALGGTTYGDNKSILYIALENSGIYSSHDGGHSWELKTNEYNIVTKIIIPQGQTDIFYAMQRRPAAPINIIRSLDGGTTFEGVFRMNEEQKNFWQDLNVEKSWLQNNLRWSYYFTKHGLAVSPHDPKVLLAATQGELFISRNAGENWNIFFSEVLPPLEGDTATRNKSIGLEVTSVWGYHFDPHDPNREYIAYTDIGFARSVDKAESWSWSAKKVPWSNTFYDLALDPHVPGKIYAATSRLHDLPHYSFITKVTPSRKLHHGGVVVSSDYGKSWKVPYNIKDKDALPLQICTTVIIDPTSPPEKRTLFAGIFGEEDTKAGVYFSTDEGKTWTATKSQPGGVNKHIYKLRFHPETGNLYCLITGYRAAKPNYHNADEGGIWMSTDKGDTWKHISKGSPLGHWATAMAFHPTDPNALYVAAASPKGLPVGGIYYTRDNGKKWWHIIGDKTIPKLMGIERTFDHWMSVLVHPEMPNIIFAGGSVNGLFFSVDGGKRWKWSPEFPFSNVQNMAVNPRNTDEIIFTTFGSGIWSTSLKKFLKHYKIDINKIKKS